MQMLGTGFHIQWAIHIFAIMQLVKMYHCFGIGKAIFFIGGAFQREIVNGNIIGRHGTSWIDESTDLQIRHHVHD